MNSRSIQSAQHPGAAGTKVFLTGAAGFIGSHLTRFLLKQGCNLYALLRPSTNTRRIGDLLPQLNIIQGNLMDEKTLGEELAKIRPEIAIHLAWYAATDDYLENPLNIPLMKASLDLAGHLVKTECRKLIVGGTCFEYDTSLGYLSESSPLKPQTLYAACKVSLHLILEQLSRQTGMPVSWVRFFHPYGPFENERRLIPSVILSLLREEPIKVTPGEQIRDFLHVEDVSAAIWAIARSKLTGAVNIGSGVPVRLRDITTKIGTILNKLELIQFGALPYGNSNPMFVCADSRKIRENTAWAPRFNLDEGLMNTVQEWKNTLSRLGV